MNAHQLDRVRRMFPCFSDIADDSWASSEMIRVTPDTPHAIREGHVLQHAMFMISGSIRVFKLSQSGKEITLYRVYGGQCCVLMMASILGETEYQASVSIEAESEVLMIPVPMFRRWMERSKPVRQFVYGQFVERMTSVTELLENVAFQSVPYRVAEFLLSESSLVETSSIRITHEQLAIELGTAREVITRVLRDFVKQGAVQVQRGRITMTDREILELILKQEM